MNTNTIEELQLLKTLIGYFDIILHGGCWSESVEYMHITYRARFDPKNHLDLIGFRIIKLYKD